MSTAENDIRRHVRRMAEREGGDIANVMTPHLLAFRELVEAAELAGLEGPVLDRAREAHAALTGWTS